MSDSDSDGTGYSRIDTPIPDSSPKPDRDMLADKMQDPDVFSFVRAFVDTAYDMNSTYGADLGPIMNIRDSNFIPNFKLSQMGLHVAIDVSGDDPMYLYGRDSEVIPLRMSYLQQRAEDLGHDFSDICKIGIDNLLRDVRKEIDETQYYQDPEVEGFWYKMPAKAATYMNLVPQEISESAAGKRGTLSMVRFTQQVNRHIVQNYEALLEIGEFSDFFVIPTIGKKKKTTIPFLINFGDSKIVAECLDAGAEPNPVPDPILTPDSDVVDEETAEKIKKVYQDNMLWLKVFGMYGKDNRILTRPEQIVSRFPKHGRIAFETDSAQFLNGVVNHLMQQAAENDQRHIFTFNSIRTNGLEVVFIGENTLDTLEGTRRKWLQTVDGQEWLVSDDGFDYLDSDWGDEYLESPAGQEFLKTPGGERFESYATILDFVEYLETVNPKTGEGDESKLEERTSVGRKRRLAEHEDSLQGYERPRRHSEQRMAIDVDKKKK